MARFIKVEAGVATNAIKADADFAAGLDGVWIEATGSEGIGWAWDGSAWTAPAAPTDAERAAALVLDASDFTSALRLALVAKGFTPGRPLTSWLMADIEARDTATLSAALALSTDDVEALKTGVIDLLATAQTYARADLRIDTFGGLYGFTTSDIDTLFLEAGA